jgi:hypothetical protein
MTLNNDDEVPMAEGICYGVSSDLVIRILGNLGETHVVVQISKTLKKEEFSEDWRYSVWAWPIMHVFYNGASLHNHERRHKFNCIRMPQPLPSGCGIRRQFTGEIQVQLPELSQKVAALLSQESINQVSS